MKTQRQAISKKIFTAALKATSEKRGSLAGLQDKEKTFRKIPTDAIMKQRWERYCKENYYAKGIEFDEVVGVLIDIVK
jgi:hypothetical protein